MPCFHPLKAFRSKTKNANGKYPVVFNPSKGFSDMPIALPCGQCVGCRLERSRQWAIRCLHEASQHEYNCFITLTYDDDHLPEDMSLNLDHFQRFMKRLRKKYPHKIRFYHCGEYGEQLGRPHYHACLFGHDFDDKTPLFENNNGDIVYTSDDLSKLWPFGLSSIGDVTFESAAYVARYIMKKVTGEPEQNHYQYQNPETGELTYRKPEYTTMSRRDGIGKSWLEQYQSDIYPSDSVVIRGQQMRPPKFYDTQFEITNPNEYKRLKAKRKTNAKKHVDNNTPARLKVRERVTQTRLTQLKRSLT